MISSNSDTSNVTAKANGRNRLLSKAMICNVMMGVMLALSILVCFGLSCYYIVDTYTNQPNQHISTIANELRMRKNALEQPAIHSTSGDTVLNILHKQKEQLAQQIKQAEKEDHDECPDYSGTCRDQKAAAKQQLNDQIQKVNEDLQAAKEKKAMEAAKKEAMQQDVDYMVRELHRRKQTKLH